MKDLELNQAPNIHYEKFFLKLNNFNKTPAEQWKVNDILGYFCHLYYRQYNVKYPFKFNSSSPSKCYEVYIVKKLSNILTTNPVQLKQYIDWVFSEKVIKAKRKITIAFLCTESFLQEFKSLTLKKEELTRSTSLPQTYQDLFLPDKITTYGDLALIFNTAKDTYQKQFDQLGETFNLSLLEKIV